MRGIGSTIALVVVLAGLGSYIYFVDSKRPAGGIDGAGPKEKVYTLEADAVEEFKLTYQGETTRLQKAEGGWKMIEPAAAEADPAEAISVAQGLTNLEIVRVVEENAGDLAPYGLAKPSIAIEFKAKGTSGSLMLGDKNATKGEIYAVKGGEKRVFLVAAFQESNFTRKPFDLREKKILKFDRDKADALSIVQGGQSIDLSRADNEWKVVKPVAGRSDSSAVESLISRLSSSNMANLLETDGKDLAKYGLDKPAMTVTVGTGSAKTVLEIGKTENDATYARDGSRPLVFTLDPTLATDLKKSVDDYRKKDLFEFRPFSLARLRAVLDAPGGAKTYEFEKVKAEKPGEPDVWKVTRVGGASHNADSAGMDDLLNKLSALRAEAFVDAKTRTGIEKPALVVSTSYDEGKFERVRFGQVGDTAFASRDGEAGAARVEKAAMEAAMLAFDKATMPPAPPAATDKPSEKK